MLRGSKIDYAVKHVLTKINGLAANGLCAGVHGGVKDEMAGPRNIVDAGVVSSIANRCTQHDQD